MGYRRGGWHGYDRMDNDSIPSTVQVLQEWQHLKVGDSVPVWRNLDFPVVALKEINILFLRARINTTAWPNHTRLVWRFHLSPYNWACPSILAQPFTDLVVLVAVRQNLRGIKARAEGRRPQPERTVYAELLMWVACFVFLAVEIVLLVRKGLLQPLLAAGGTGLMTA